MLQTMGWEGGLSRWCEAREAVVESLLWLSVVVGRRVQVVQAR